jgi:hypothetical protein
VVLMQASPDRKTGEPAVPEIVSLAHVGAVPPVVEMTTAALAVVAGARHKVVLGQTTEGNDTRPLGSVSFTQAPALRDHTSGALELLRAGTKQTVVLAHTGWKSDDDVFGIVMLVHAVPVVASISVPTEPPLVVLPVAVA